MKDIFQVCGCNWFPMYRRPFYFIRSIKEGNGIVRGSCYKLYRYACSGHTRRWNEQKGSYDCKYEFVDGKFDTLEEKTGMSRVGVMSAKDKLRDMKLLRVEDGHIQAVADVIMAAVTGIDGVTVEDINNVTNSYFPVPTVSMRENKLCEK